jgi:hypothetical protein
LLLSARESLLRGREERARGCHADPLPRHRGLLGQRQGRPEVTEVEVALTGDSAEIRACLDEDGWPFVKGGKTSATPSEAPARGAVATRSGDGWIITDVRLPAGPEKTCS